MPEEIMQSKAIFELKHSIEVHTMIHGGPTPQLAVFLLKVIDLIEDTDIERRDAETLSLAFIIIEAVAVHVQKHLDEKEQEAKKGEHEFPAEISQKNGDILVAVGRTRHMDDKLEAKTTVLKAIAVALRSLSSYTKANYPAITDSHKRQL